MPKKNGKAGGNAKHRSNGHLRKFRRRVRRATRKYPMLPGLLAIMINKKGGGRKSSKKVHAPATGSD